MRYCCANKDVIQIVESTGVTCSAGGAYIDLARTAHISRGALCCRDSDLASRQPRFQRQSH